MKYKEIKTAKLKSIKKENKMIKENRIIKKFSALLASFILSFIPLFVMVPTVHAAAETCTWTGAGADAKFSTVDNWGAGAGCHGTGVIADGDSLTFGAIDPAKSPINDIDNMSFATLTFNDPVSITGTPFTLTNGITATTGLLATIYIANNITLSGSQAINVGANHGIFLSGVLGGSGDITKSGTGYMYLVGANTSYSGAITVSAGSLNAKGANALGSTAAGTTVNVGGDLELTTCDASLTVAENLTLSGASSLTTGDFPKPKLYTAAKVCGGGFGTVEPYGVGANDGLVTLSGSITLGSDVTFGSGSTTTTISSAVSGGFSFTMLVGYIGKLVANGTTLTPATFSKTLSDDQPSNTVTISGNSVITIDGKRSDTAVNSGGKLMGTGTVGFLSVYTSGTVAPGHSPGCITSSGLILSGTYDAELGGTVACTGYDQLTVNGTVNVTGGTLNVSRYNNFKPVAGQKYTIISNDAADAVTGTFTNLAEGATFTVDGYVFKISYVGGDGNDVVLTVQSVPAVPDTGFKLLQNNPIITLFTTTVLAGAMLLIAKKYGRSFNR